MAKTGGLLLTDVLLRAQPPAPPRQRIELVDSACPGLRLRIDDSGRKIFSVLRTVSEGPDRGKRVRVTLRPPYPALSIAAARRQALQMLARIDKGDVPVSAARERARLPDDARFAAQWELYRRLKVGSLRARSFKEIERPFRRSFLPAWAKRDVTTITRAEIADLLDDLQLSRGIVVRNRAQASLSTFFAWLVDRGRLDASPIAGMKRAAGEHARDRFLTDPEIAALWVATAPGARWPSLKPDGAPIEAHPVFSALLRVLLLTGQRLGEVAGMRWDELEDGGTLWRIPASRYKTRTEQLVPLSAPVAALIRSMPRLEHVAGEGLRQRLVPSPFVFTTRGDVPFSGDSKLKPYIEVAVKAHLRQMAREAGAGAQQPPEARWTIHDLRRTARTLLQRLGTPYDVGEAILGHKLPGVGGVYARHSFAAEKRQALDKLAELVASIAKTHRNPSPADPGTKSGRRVGQSRATPGHEAGHRRPDPHG